MTLDSSLETAGAHARRVVVVGAGSHDQLGVVRGASKRLDNERGGGHGGLAVSVCGKATARQEAMKRCEAQAQEGEHRHHVRLFQHIKLSYKRTEQEIARGGASAIHACHNSATTDSATALDSGCSTSSGHN